MSARYSIVHRNMLRIAIVEDTKEERDHLLSLLERYMEENSVSFEVTAFDNGFLFLDGFKPVYDLVFMDIAMPGINGVDVSARLRKVDEFVSLVFVTNLAQYAIKGYQVSAMDFLLKPVNYAQLSRVLVRAIKKKEENVKKDIVIKTTDSFVKIASEDIVYVDSDDHIIIYHCVNDTYETWSSLKQTQESLPSNRFYRLGKSVIVNLSFVKGINKGEVFLTTGDHFPLPRGKKGEFVAAMGKFLEE